MLDIIFTVVYCFVIVLGLWVGYKLYTSLLEELEQDIEMEN